LLLLLFLVKKDNMKKILLLVLNVDYALLSHRIDIAIAAKKNGYEVHVACGITERKETLLMHGFIVHDTKSTRCGLNFFKEAAVFFRIFFLLKNLSPDVIHLITIKPMVYGGIASKLLRIKGIIFSVSGLGYIFSSNQWKAKILKKIMKPIYRFIFSIEKSSVVLQNKDDTKFLTSSGILNEDKVIYIPGSGFQPHKVIIKKEPKKYNVLMASRMLQDKGVFEFISASKKVAEVFPDVKFTLAGGFDKENPESINKDTLLSLLKNSPVKYIGFSSNIYKELSDCNIAVLPSYREGFPRFLIEAAASERALISTYAPGCQEVVNNYKTGLLVPIKNSEALADAIIFLLNNESIRVKMAKSARKESINIFHIDHIIRAHMVLYDQKQAKVV
jgi:glycosyltransferase involved in cell wall biosynthesis